MSAHILRPRARFWSTTVYRNARFVAINIFYPIITPLNNHYYFTHYYFTHYQSITTNQSLNRPTNLSTKQPTDNMKFTLAALAANIVATTMANPILSKHWGQRWGHNKEEGKRPRKNFHHIDPST
jgi:hypothetical protein